MSFLDAVKTCFRKYVVFSGRASRPEYWWFVLFLLIGGVVLGFVDLALFGTTTVQVTPTEVDVRSNGILTSIFQLGTLVPSLSAAWRRMHDTGRSGLYVLYPLIVMVGLFSFLAVVGGLEPLMQGEFEGLFAGAIGLTIGVTLIVMLISPLLVIWWLSRPSQPGPNEYGPNPHEVTS